MEFQAPPVPLEYTPEGVIRITGTRVTLDSVLYHFNHGATPETIAQKYPTLSLSDVYAVIAYYLQHRQPLDAYLAESERVQEQIDDRIDADYPQTGIRERLLARRTSST
ncbi:MAG: DUF433 domain-containing protein [Anaerolineae bacterium]|nr:DUF433 domain-containing protein [Anaerolineae bacterium]